MFDADWQDDGKEFSCEARENKDQYFSPKISLTVEYGPKETKAEISNPNVTEGQHVTLTCSTRGRPIPSVTWFRGEEHMSSGPAWTITSITRSQQGEYHCVSTNTQGQMTSNNVTINVKYPPSVEISSPKYEFTEGEEMELECKVIDSNPQPHTFHWHIAEETLAGNWKKHVLSRIRPEDGGKYTCTATNTAGPGTSMSHIIVVNYKPRKTNISIKGTSIISSTNNVKVNSYLAIICNTDAHPAPFKYQWNCDSEHQCTNVTSENSLVFHHVQRTDEMCYTCTATNNINTGNRSNPFCIRVLYPPMKPTLIMKSDIREGQAINITCTVESFPLSRLTLTWTSKSTPETQKQLSTNNDRNTLLHIFKVTSADGGFYTCSAENSEGSNSIKTELVVKYSPKNVRIEAQPERVVNEKEKLILHCVAKSNPPLTKFTWMKTADRKEEVIGSTPTFTITSASPSDSGDYSCTAANTIGAGKSQPYRVNVRYAPKHTQINRSAEQQRPDGIRFVTLTCSSQSFPPVQKYAWYGEMKDKPRILLAEGQRYTVYSNQPGKYYCIATNSISEKMSEGAEVFLESGFRRFLPYILAFLAVVIILLLFLWFRRKRTLHQQTSNAQPWWSCSCFMVPCGDTRRVNLVNECRMAEACRSREDLLPPHSRSRPQSGPRQPLQDSMSTSYITTVYCSVAQPVKKQGLPAKKPIQQRDACQQDDSVTYTTLHFGDKQKNKQAKAGDDVYAQIVKKKMPKKEERGTVEDYENISTSKSPNENYDTDTSEDEVEVNYSHVMFKAKPGQQRASTDSDDEEEKTGVKT
ncbi:B-cell receptor CD22 [Thalassophryne amazonica]|uniref:B-cell receptor CD22 n=1 Tax=Thalassophryne amazonica TaxID=390379 RepID=UPI0014713767|nr:B-cell receptor CD22 [Thalassophryne amazonica]